MKSLDNEDKLVMFDSVANMIKNRNIPVNDNLISRVRKVEEFFYEFAESIESILDEKKPYKFNAVDLRKMLEFIGYSLEPSENQEIGLKRIKSELGRAVFDFRKYITRLQELEEKPKRFFSDNSRVEEIYKISNKMKNFYRGLVDEEDFRESFDD